MEKVKLIAITGGIGSGKSTVTTMIKDMGFTTLSCDAIVSELYQKRKVKLLIKKRFPTAVKGFLFPKLDRKELSSIVFKDKEKLQVLTHLITPIVLDEVINRAKKLTGKVFVEVPLLFECEYQNKFDLVIVVMRALEQRVESVKKRSSLTEEEILARVNSQVNYDTLNLSNYIVIENNLSVEILKEKVINIIENI